MLYINDLITNESSIFIILYECNFKSNDGHRMFHVKCSNCGFETDMQMHRIKYIKSCNHLSSGNIIKHINSFNNKRISKIFSNMKLRCYDKNDNNYKFYGAKGIKIFKEWLDNPSLFEKWALSNGYADNLTIDRIDSNKDYCPENCRWISMQDNSKYKSTTNIININGVIDSGIGWSYKLGHGKNYINKMIKKYGLDYTINFIKNSLDRK